MKDSFYDVNADALSFVMPFVINALPITHLFLGFFLAAWTMTFLVRIVLTWYPATDLKKGFWIVVGWPTEPILSLTRRFVPPIGGVDVSPVIWVGLISLIRELLVGQQGVLTQILLKSQSIG